MEESQRETLDRLQKDYVSGALSAEEYTRLREQVLAGTQMSQMQPMPPYEVRFVPAGTDVVTGAPLASWGRRVGGFFIDLAVLIASYVPTITWAVSTHDPVTDEISDDAALVLGLQIIFLPSLYSWVMLGIWGQTVGKMAVGIAVRRGADAHPIGFARALGRVASVFVLGILSIPLLLSYLWPLWDSRNQTLHDKMANTIVVRTGGAPQLGPAG
jgi:uncharacterized RDD family membrane protein YckC